ncbi:MAG: AMP-binding protein [Ornithinimicrobium sp.]
MPALDLSEGLPHPLRPCLEDALAADRSVIVATSGSTGSAKKVVLSANALMASARATHERIGGPGQWLASLSAAHVAGLQVWVRSYLSGVAPVQMPSGPFTPSRFAAAAARLQPEHRHYVSLVPTQAHRLISDPVGRAALAGFDRVLIGGAPLPLSLATRLSDAGVVWTHTYGMSETCGGCVYDGVPLPGVEVRTDGALGEPGRLFICGPVLAQGYLQRADLTEQAFLTLEGTRWFQTSDIGVQDLATGRWRVLGRLDDVINSGGHKVHPDAVRDALLDLGVIEQAAVVALPDPEWGQRVAALIVPNHTHVDAQSLQEDPTRWLRTHLGPSLPNYALPARVTITDRLPRLPGGKVDGAGVQAAIIQEDDRL